MARVGSSAAAAGTAVQAAGTGVGHTQAAEVGRIQVARVPAFLVVRAYQRNPELGVAAEDTPAEADTAVIVAGGHQKIQAGRAAHHIIVVGRAWAPVRIARATAGGRPAGAVCRTGWAAAGKHQALVEPRIRAAGRHQASAVHIEAARRT